MDFLPVGGNAVARSRWERMIMNRGKVELVSNWIGWGTYGCLVSTGIAKRNIHNSYLLTGFFFN